MHETIITAHSGCEGTGIDTMDSIEKALEIGADAIEIDVRMDPLENLRVSHDPLSLEDYLKKNPLDDVFREIYPSSLMINFDLKEEKALDKTIRAAREFGFPAERLILTGCPTPDRLLEEEDLSKKASFFLNISRVLKYIYIHRKENFSEELFAALMEDPLMLVIDENSMIPDVYFSDVMMLRQKLYAISKTLRDKIIEDTMLLYQESGAKGFNVPKILLGTGFLKSLNAAGIPLSVWTVNEPDLIRHCLDIGACNITTRLPSLALRLRDEYDTGDKLS